MDGEKRAGGGGESREGEEEYVSALFSKAIGCFKFPSEVPHGEEMEKTIGFAKFVLCCSAPPGKTHA